MMTEASPSAATIVPIWVTCSPASVSTRVAAAASVTTTAMPMPQLNTRSISRGSMPPVRASQAKTGGTGQFVVTAAARPSGSTRGRLPTRPPPVICAAAFSRPARCSASSDFT